MTIEQKIEKRISDDMQYLARELWAARPAAKKKPREKTEEEKKADAKRGRIVTKKARKADAERKRKGMDKEKAHIDKLYHEQKEARA